MAEELIKELVSENETSCDEALECVTNLKQFKEKVCVVKVKKSEAKRSHGLDQIFEWQKEMNAIVVNQMKQQRELLEKQEINEKELSTTVKLPKVERMVFSGDKLKWAKFWDSSKCALHHNKTLSNIEKVN